MQASMLRQLWIQTKQHTHRDILCILCSLIFNWNLSSSSRALQPYNFHKFESQNRRSCSGNHEWVQTLLEIHSSAGKTFDFPNCKQTEAPVDARWWRRWERRRRQQTENEFEIRNFRCRIHKQQFEQTYDSSLHRRIYRKSREKFIKS